jgi:hypothetical protein
MCRPEKLYIRKPISGRDIVEKPEDYLHNSARDYYGLPGLLDIILVEPTVRKRPY